MYSRVAFVGAFGSGKTHMAEWLSSENGYKKFSFATGLKLIARDFYGMSLGGTKDRKLLQELGDAMRSVNEDVFAIKTMKEIDIYQCSRRDWEPVKPVVVDDLRFKNEADFLRKGGFLIIRILPRERLDNDNPLRFHQSETEMNQIDVDYEVVSGDTDSLINIISTIEFGVRIK